jgi:hypothetical protein
MNSQAEVLVSQSLPIGPGTGSLYRLIEHPTTHLALGRSSPAVSPRAEAATVVPAEQQFEGAQGPTDAARAAKVVCTGRPVSSCFCLVDVKFD